MPVYTRLTLEEREELSRYLALNYSYRQIGNILKRSPSTINREVRRRSFTRFGYRATTAHNQASRLARIPRRKRILDENPELLRIVIRHLKNRWSPVQIAKRLKTEYPDDMSKHISHETIYAYIYVHPRMHLKRQLLQYLRRRHKHRRTKNKHREKSRPIQDFVSIDERPPEINTRRIAGHWEGDLIMGPLNKTAIGTLVERTTRLTLIVRLNSKDAESVRKAFARKMNRLPEHLRKSLTYDQGQEMAEHKQFKEQTNVQVYFAHPHSPWERGSSENTNMLIRDFFPRGTDFSKVSDYKLRKVENLLNDRPRQVLNFYTPREVFTKAVALEL